MCRGRYHLTTRIIFGTWRAAGSRPYDLYIICFVNRIFRSFLTNYSTLKLRHTSRGGYQPPAPERTEPFPIKTRHASPFGQVRLASPHGRGGRAQRGRRGSTLRIPIRYHSKNAPRPSQSRLRRASSPRGRAKGRGWFCFIRTGCIRGVSGTAHRPFPTVSLESSTSAPVVPTMLNAVTTAYSGPPSPKGKVLRGSVQPHRVYSKRGGRLVAAPT